MTRMRTAAIQSGHGIRSKRRAIAWGFAGVVSTTAIACNEDGADEDDDTQAQCEQDTPYVVPMRRLTRTQYENTIRDLFGGRIAASERFPSSSAATAFATYADANPVTLPGARAIMEAAEEVAQAVGTRLEHQVDCNPDVGDRPCATAYIDDLADRAFRRPSTAEERQALYALFDAAPGDFRSRMAAVISAILQMPAYLYLVERGNAQSEGDVLQLTDYEIASRLSFLLWDTMPDEQLRAAAAAGELQTPQGRESHARRLLENRELSLPVMSDFYRQWFHLDEFEEVNKDRRSHPDYRMLKPYMDEEIDRFIEYAVFEAGDLDSLLTSNVTYVNTPLAQLYGVNANPGEDQWQRVELNAEQRPGILTRAATLSTFAWTIEPSPVFRGRFVREQLLCQPPPEAPPDAFDVPPEGDTVRERAEFLIEDEYCGACHSLLDGIGLGLLSYNAIGQWTSDDPIDAQGEVLSSGEDVNGPFSGAVELTSRIADSDAATNCAVRQVFQYGVGRDVNSGDSCAVGALRRAFVDNDRSLQELMLALVRAESFGQRRLENGQ